MANEKITPANIDTYLGFLSRKLNQPVANGQSWTKLSQEEINRKLSALYDQLGIPQMRGWKYENAFAEANVPPGNYGYEETPPPVSSPVIYRYESVEQGIGQQNYKAFVHWLQEKTKKPVNFQQMSGWAQYSDQAIRNALPGLYQEMDLLPAAVKEYERSFLVVFGAFTTQPPVTPAPVAPAPAAQPVAKKEAPLPRANKSYRKGITISVAVFVILLLMGGWVWHKYHVFSNLPNLYPRTDNIALRAAPLDAADIKGRMDLYGRYMDKSGVVKPSDNKLKLLNEDAVDGFYKATATPDFMAYLTGKENAVYVHSALVTKDEQFYNNERNIFENLSAYYNEMDKLPLGFRNLIVTACTSSGPLNNARIATACNASIALSKTAPVSIGKYKDKSTNTLYAVLRSTNDMYYVASGVIGSIVSVSKVNFYDYDGTPVSSPSAGMFRAAVKNSNKLILDYCSGDKTFWSIPLYTDFYCTSVP